MKLTHLLIVLVLGFGIVGIMGCMSEQIYSLGGFGDLSCGKESPDSRDACCANKNKDTTDFEYNGFWKYHPCDDATSCSECMWVCANESVVNYPSQCQ
ncbi:MAG: hypothetical protein ABIG39_03250 [Candidatus Micrarchaeota archaeon]